MEGSLGQPLNVCRHQADENAVNHDFVFPNQRTPLQDPVDARWCLSSK
jgi:hypothetical protein